MKGIIIDHCLLRDTLLPKIPSGELRVKDLDIIILDS